MAIVVAALLLVVVALDLVLRSVDQERLRRVLEGDVSEALGRPAEIDSLRVTLLPLPELEATGLRVHNEPGRPSSHSVVVGELELGFRILPAFFGLYDVRSLELRDAELHLEQGAEGRLGLPIRLDEIVDERRDDEIELHVQELLVERLGVFVWQGEAGGTESAVIEEFRAQSRALGDPVSLALRGRFEGSPFSVAGEVGALSEWLDPSQPVPLRLNANVFDAEIEVEGTIADPGRLSGVDVDVSATIAQPFLPRVGALGIGRIDLDGHLSDLDGSLGLEQLEVETSGGDGLNVDVQGRIDDLMGFAGVEVGAELNARKLAFLDPLADAWLDPWGFDVERIEEARIEARLTDETGGIALLGSISMLAKGGAVSLELEGRTGDLLGISDLDLDFVLEARDLVALANLLDDPPEVPAIGPVQARGRLRNRANKTYALEDLSMQIGTREDVWIAGEGRIADLVAREGVEIRLEMAALESARLGELLGFDLREVGALRAISTITDADGSLGIEGLRIDGEGGGHVEIHVSAAIDDLNDLDEISFDLELKARDLRTLGRLAGLELPAVGPFTFSGQVRGSDEHLASDSVELLLGETRLVGDFAATFAPGSRPSLRAHIDSPNLRIQDALAVARSFEVERDPDEEVDLPFDRLRILDLDLDIEIRRMTGVRGFDAQDLHGRVTLRDGNLVVGDVRAVYKRGEVTAALHADTRTPTPIVEAYIDAQGLDLETLVSQFADDTDFDGIIDLTLDVESRGRDLAALRRGLQGDVRVVSTGGRASSRYARAFVVNMVHVVFPTLRADGAKRIGCAMLAARLDDGVARVDDLLLAEGRITITGEGTVDLVEERYDLLLRPTTSDPGLVSMAPHVEVTGSLASPEFRARRSTLLTSLARGFVANLSRLGRSANPFSRREEVIARGTEACERLSKL